MRSSQPTGSVTTATVLVFEDVDGTYIRMLFPHRIDELDEVLPFIRDRLANESAASGWLLWGVLVASKSQAAIPNEYELIGISGFEGPPSVHGQVEIGYAITPAFRGQGIATEAVGLLVSHAMRRGARRIVAEVYPFKRGSIRVLEKTGFQLMGQGATRGTMRFAVEAEEC